jgi:hypothetical protein
LLLKPEFIITESGKIDKVKWKTASDSLTMETNRILAFFPKAITPPTRNGKPTNLYIKELVELEINSADENYIKNAIKSKNSTLNPNSELALHFKNFITEEEISKYTLPNSERTISINFSLDKNGKIINSKTNTKNKELDEKLLLIFKKFPFEKLNITSKNVLETYYYTIFTIEHYKKIVIHCNEKPEVFSESIFDEKCEKSDSPADLSFCFREKITYQIIKNFDSSLISQNDKENGIRLICVFQVDIDGTISRINAVNTNPKFSNELDRIIKKMPKAYKPALKDGMPIKTTYAIPISF